MMGFINLAVIEGGGKIGRSEGAAPVSLFLVNKVLARKYIKLSAPLDGEPKNNIANPQPSYGNGSLIPTK